MLERYGYWSPIWMCSNIAKALQNLDHNTAPILRRTSNVYMAICIVLMRSTGCSISSMHASHCRASGSPCRLRYYAVGYCCMLAHTSILGFITAGIPVYYITQTNESARPRIICKQRNCATGCISSNLFTAVCRSYILKLVGRSPAAEGWEAVATDGDEAVEMVENRRAG